MRPNAGLRDPFEQAKLWRQSRSIEEILAAIDELRSVGAPFLAHCLESVGPQHGDPVTNAPPGYSWHQWGEAVDCFWLLGGKAEWSSTKKVGGLNAYAYSQMKPNSSALSPEATGPHSRIGRTCNFDPTPARRRR